MRPTTKDAYQLLLEGSTCLAEISHHGMRVDEDYLDRALANTAAKVKSGEEELKACPEWKGWVKRFGAEAKTTSRTQLGTVLYEVMGYESKAETGTGRYKTDRDALEWIDTPFVNAFKAVEKWRKVHATYLTGIKRETVGGYIHPFLSMVGGSANDDRGPLSFRSSAQAPNVHNMPIRDPEMGKVIRDCFVARDGCRLNERDYSGIEVYVGYCYHLDPAVRRDLTDSGYDAHADTACDLFMCSKADVSKLMRYCAKNGYVFAQQYGDYYVSCARRLWNMMAKYRLTLNSGVSVRDHLASKGVKILGACDPRGRPAAGTYEHVVKQTEDYYWGTRYKVQARWRKDWWRDYQRRGYFDVVTGFRVHGEGGWRRNQVLNVPIQGPAFHCPLKAAVLITGELKRRRMKSKVVNIVHDSILADVPEVERDGYNELCERVMTVEVQKLWPWIVLPLKTECEESPVGGSWAEKKEQD